MTAKLVTIVGATGQQGRAVIAAFINNPAYKIRGLTRNPNSETAKALSSQGIEMVGADISDLNAIKSAFEGSHIIFAVTNFYELFEKHGPAKAKELERDQGINMAKAASTTSTLEHYIWSTLPDDTKEYPVPHFEGKHAVDVFIKQDPALLAKTTFLMICFYAKNLQLELYRPYWIDTAKKYVQFTAWSPTTPIPFIGDVANVTAFVKAIVEQPDETKNGTMIIGSIGSLSAKEYIETWAKAQGKEVQLVQVEPETLYALWPWPSWTKEFVLMMKYFEDYPISKWLDPGQKYHTAETLKITGIITVQDWAKSWKLPA